jgi:hypothetical protein
MKKSWRTSVAGVGMIVCGAGGLAAMLLAGQMPTSEQWTMFGALIVGGFGQLAAADSKQLPPSTP